MIFKIAWKNLWRNKVRSFVVITAIGLGLWAGIFGSAFVTGMMKSKVDNVVKNETSHFQIHQEKFTDEYNGKLIIENSNEINQKLKADPDVQYTSERVIAMGMMASSRKQGSLKLVGVDVEDEKQITKIHEKIIEGSFFEKKRKNPIVISKETAEDYKVKINSKITVTFQDIDGEITSGAFRVVGIYNTSNNMHDRMNAFVQINDLRRLYNVETGAHEIAVWLKDHEQAQAKADEYKEVFTNLEVKSWLEIMPEMSYMIEMMDLYLYIIVGIILFALLFSIVNTMLMAVLERVRELGMLMAIGMTKGRVFLMIMTETVMMSLIGVPLGILISEIFIGYFGTNGINLSGAQYEDLGFSSIIYPYIDSGSYLEVTVMVFFMALAAAVYPAYKALKLNPTTAIRKI
jgi:ABC-type lipoprotein release transport system permease subunit